jgi:hypothetical protein
MWGSGPADPLARKQLSHIKGMARDLADAVPLVDYGPLLAPLVSAKDLRTAPVHRWFGYKEGFSPILPSTVLDLLEVADGLVAADPFGGVATTALALREDPRIREVRSVEYSPLAHAIGEAKLAWPKLDPSRLRELTRKLIRYRCSSRSEIPSLAAFGDSRIFDRDTVVSLVSARDSIQRAAGLSDDERAFLRVGLAAIVEDASKAMKDGRALRILRDRRRIATSLRPEHPRPTKTDDSVKRLLADQWAAMIEDLEQLEGSRGCTHRAAAVHLRGDARRLAACRMPETGNPAFPEGSVDISIFSPPYLNFIDYSEIYKLELWLLGFVADQAAFRRLRLGTLRSHPSVRFGERPGPSGGSHPAIDLVHRMSGWVSGYGARPEVAPIIRQYFEDMHSVFLEQARILRPGGIAVCVVANSTLSRRRKDHDAHQEFWRIPILTDVLLAHIAELAGFSSVELWRARDLRPRNVRGGAARESLVVAIR